MCHYDWQGEKTARRTRTISKKVCKSSLRLTASGILFYRCGLGAPSINTTTHWAPSPQRLTGAYRAVQWRGGEQFITSITATIIVCRIDSFVLLFLWICFDQRSVYVNAQVKVSTLFRQLQLYWGIYFRSRAVIFILSKEVDKKDALRS